MLQLRNTSPFHATIVVIPDERGVDMLLVAVKGTFSLGNGLEIGQEQRQVTMADVYQGEQGASSIRYVSEIHPAKRSTDVAMVGEACAPDGRRAERLDVSLSVGDRKKIVRVFGDRRWESGLVGLGIGAPAPFERMPLTYERAFGGAHEADPEKGQTVFEPRNPVGMGLMGTRKRGEMKGVPLPNLEDPLHPIRAPEDRPQPAGFGFVAPSWEPRKSLAGTYGEKWRRERAPFLPYDFDPRFFNAAHPNLVCRGHLRGGEPVEVVNASPKGPLRFRLPWVDLASTVRIGGKEETPSFLLETVLLEPSANRLCMLWRASVPCGKRVLRVEWVEVSLRKLDVGGSG